MNHLKMAGMRDGITDMLTYADNFATGYFKKQGFTTAICMERRRWKGYIKDYEGGTLMHCAVAPGIDYRNIPGMIRSQRKLLVERIRKLDPAAAAALGLDSASAGSGSGALAPAVSKLPAAKQSHESSAPAAGGSATTLS